MLFLAVDDEAYALGALTAAIQKARPDAEVRAFRTAQEALAFVQQNIVDVVFLDIELCGISGIELAKKIKDIRAYTNVVFVTGYSRYALDAFSMFVSGYLLKPVTAEAIQGALRHLRNPIRRCPETGLYVQTFGNFEVFYNGEPLHFARSKAKELFAYLIHKRGTSCSSREIAAVLFEDKPYSVSLQKQVQTILSTMVKTLREVGQGDIIQRTFNSTAINVDKVNCDFYRFIRWDLDAVNGYMGEYMSNYEWAEFTVGYLDSKVL